MCYFVFLFCSLVIAHMFLCVAQKFLFVVFMVVRMFLVFEECWFDDDFVLILNKVVWCLV